MTNHKILAHIFTQLKKLTTKISDNKQAIELQTITEHLGLMLIDYTNQRNAQRADYLALRLFIENEMKMRKKVRSWSDAQRQAKLAEAEKAMKALQHLIPWAWQDAPEQVQGNLFQQETIND